MIKKCFTRYTEKKRHEYAVMFHRQLRFILFQLLLHVFDPACSLLRLLRTPYPVVWSPLGNVYSRYQCLGPYEHLCLSICLKPFIPKATCCRPDSAPNNHAIAHLKVQKNETFSQNYVFLFNAAALALPLPCDCNVRTADPGFATALGPPRPKSFSVLHQTPPQRGSLVKSVWYLKPVEVGIAVIQSQSPLDGWKTT